MPRLGTQLQVITSNNTHNHLASAKETTKLIIDTIRMVNGRGYFPATTLSHFPSCNLNTNVPQNCLGSHRAMVFTDLGSHRPVVYFGLGGTSPGVTLSMGSHWSRSQLDIQVKLNKGHIDLGVTLAEKSCIQSTQTLARYSVHPIDTGQVFSPPYNYRPGI